MSLPEISPYQTAVIFYLAGLGFNAEEIAADYRVNVSASQVVFYIDRIGLGVTLPKCGAARDLRLKLSPSCAKALHGAAFARRTTSSEIAERIFQHLLEGQLVGAILDDGVPG